MHRFPYSIVDLSHVLSEHTPSWDGSCGFKLTQKCDYGDCSTPVKFRVQNVSMHAGIGTHIDAPAHCFSGAKAIDQIETHDLFSPCIVIDVSSRAHENYSVSVADIIEHEQKYGEITANSFVLIKTGWSQFWHTPQKYRNNLMFPSVSLDAANLLLERNIVGLGIDTLSPDRPQDEYRVHEALLGAQKYIIENIKCDDKLPATGSYILALPLKIAGATEAPVRLVALISRQNEHHAN